MRWLVAGAVLLALVGATRAFLRLVDVNAACCHIPWARNLAVSLTELIGVAPYLAEIGQDKWVLETVFPEVTDGYFVDVGSGHGTIGSNTRALERRGWRGLCIDPFPVEMQGRSCRVFRDVVFDRAGVPMTFHMAGGLGGLAATLAPWNRTGAAAPTVVFRTRTLRDILREAEAPAFVHFLSLDIEGAELEALAAFPFDEVRIGALVVEHNREEPKRSDIEALLARDGYRRSHSYHQDDFYLPAPPH